jgi:acetyltransferase-like isoleucine patch superfamily enzyme
VSIFNKVIERAAWPILRRYIVRRQARGFIAGPFTYATPDCKFGEYSALWGTARLFRSTLGRFSYLAGGRVVNTTVGDFSSIGQQVLIGGFGAHPTRWLTTHPAFYSTLGQTSLTFVDRDGFPEYSPVIIGSDVWIGTRAMVLDGVNIGDGAIIGAGSVVTRDVKPFEVVAGVPARRLRARFDDETISRLQHSQWWRADVDTLRRLAPLFCCDDPAPLLDALAAAQKPNGSPLT